MTALRDAIAYTCSDVPCDPWGITDPQDEADAILAMPEMEWIRDALNRPAFYDDPTCPPSVREWVLD